jgi:hypothetical protein
MNLVINPPKKEWSDILQRPVFDAKNLMPMVQEVLNAIQEKGDQAVKDYTLSFDQVNLSSIQLNEDQINQIASTLDSHVKKAIEVAKINIENSHLFSFICALIFLFHPSHSEVVNNIKCRDELIASGMGFLAALFFVKHNENKNIKYLLIGCLFIITGLLAKMTTILFLFIIPLSLLFFYNSKIKKVI